jgi:hypothetical protein
MNRARLLIYLLLLSFNVGAQDLDAILELNAAAHGGADNFKRIENVRFQLTISEPGFEVSGTYVATRHGSMRIDIEADGQRVFSEGLHQGQAWQWKPGSGFEDQDGEAAAALRHGIDSPGRFFTMNQVRERGATITLEGAVPEGDPQQWQLRIVLPDGFSRDYFIDQESGRTVRERDYRVNCGWTVYCALHAAKTSTQTPETGWVQPRCARWSTTLTSRKAISSPVRRHQVGPAAKLQNYLSTAWNEWWGLQHSPSIPPGRRESVGQLFS